MQRADVFANNGGNRRLRVVQKSGGFLDVMNVKVAEGGGSTSRSRSAQNNREGIAEHVFLFVCPGIRWFGLGVYICFA